MAALALRLRLLLLLLLAGSKAQAIRPSFSWDFLGNMTFIHTCNESGLFNDEALDAVVKFPFVTIEKGQGFNDGTGRFAEQKIVEQLAAVKQRNPAISTVFYMNSVLDWYFYEMHKEFLAHPAWWLYDSQSGKPVRCGGDRNFDPPKGGMLAFDHAKPEVRAWWGGVCATAVASGVVDGCFSDSSQPGSHGTGKHLNASGNALYEKGKVETMSAVTKKFEGTAGKPFKGSTGVLIGKKPDQQGINAFQIEFFGPSEASIHELQAGVKQGYLIEAHTHVVDDTGCKSPKMESVVAAFLIGAGEDCYFGSGLWISNGTLDVTQRWCPPLFERPLGEPAADAVKDEAGVYTRNFSSGTKVFFNSRTNTGQVWWHGDPPPPAPPVPSMQCGAGESSLLKDSTFSGHDVATNITADAEGCCALCTAAVACVQWSWHPHAKGKWSPKMCHLHGASAVVKHARSIHSAHGQSISL